MRALALIWLTGRGKPAFESKKDAWIIDLYDKAAASANDGYRQDALGYLIARRPLPAVV
ncbi:MAG: hypothetical protein WBW81_12185 [Methylocella sp.]